MAGWNGKQGWLTPDGLGCTASWHRALGCTFALPLPSFATPHHTAPLARPLCRLEVRCGGLEGEIKELRKSQKETVSELKLEQNSVKQAAYEVREAAERRQQQLGEALAAAEARAAELEEAASKAAEAAQRSAGKLERQLAELQAEHAELREQHDKVSGWELHTAWLCVVQSVSWVE